MTNSHELTQLLYGGRPREHEDFTACELDIRITGNQPGTGASTLMRKLAAVLELDTVSVGKYRRALAVDYVHDKEFEHSRYNHYEGLKAIAGHLGHYALITSLLPQHPPEKIKDITRIIFTPTKLPRRLQWRAFANRKRQLFDEPNPARRFIEYLSNFGGQTASENDLAALDNDQNEYGKKDSFLEILPDLILYYLLVNSENTNGQISEGKLAVILDDLMPRLGDKAPEKPSRPGKKRVPINIFLEVTPDTSAKRVLSREIQNGKIRYADPAVTSEQLLKALWDDESGTDPKIQTWLNTQINLMKRLNHKRIVKTDERFTRAYNLPPTEDQQISRENIRNRNGLIVIDAEQSVEDVLWSTLYAIYDALGWEDADACEVWKEKISYFFDHPKELRAKAGIA